MEIDFKDPKYYTNRELSWVLFDYRVLNEARDKSIPLFERLKFLSITTSKSSPICVRSSRLLGEADASMIFLFMMCLRDKSSAFDGRLSRSLLCFLNGLQAESILRVKQLLSSLVLLLIAAIRL